MLNGHSLQKPVAATHTADTLLSAGTATAALAHPAADSRTAGSNGPCSALPNAVHSRTTHHKGLHTTRPSTRTIDVLQHLHRREAAAGTWLPADTR